MKARGFLAYLFTPVTVSFLAIATIAYAGDRLMGVWSFVCGYTGFLAGVHSNPITPYTDGLSILFLFGIPILLHGKGVSLIDSLAIAIGTILASLTSFEFWWNMFFLVGHPVNSWFGFPGSYWYYVFAFNSLAALWLVGAKYWRFSYYTVLLLLAYPASFVAWYLSGYPQTWASYAVDPAYVWNVCVKIVAFTALFSPILTYGLRKESRGQIGRRKLSASSRSDPV